MQFILNEGLPNHPKMFWTKYAKVKNQKVGGCVGVCTLHIRTNGWMNKWTDFEWMDTNF